METEEALELLELAGKLLKDKTGKPLSDLEEIVLRGMLANLSYQEICQQGELKNYSSEYVERYIAYNLRKRLAEALKQVGVLEQGKVTKKNLAAKLREARDILRRDRQPMKPNESATKSVTSVTPAAAKSVTSVTPAAAKSVTSVTPSAAKSVTSVTPAAAKSVTSVTPSAANNMRPCHNLPAPDRTAFVGYQEQLAHLLELLSPSHRAHRISIEGIGGAGKTTLILEAAYRCLAGGQFEAIVFTSAQPHRLAGDRILRRIKQERTLRDIFRTICRALERPDILAADFEIQLEGIQDLLADRSVLLIVDNLETIEDQEDVCSFLYELPAKVKAVATSRDRAPLDSTIHLESLSAGDAARLIELQAREKNIQLDPEDGQKLYQKTGGIPGAIVYTMGQLAGDYLLTDVLARLDSNSPSDLTRYCFESSVLHLKKSPAHPLLMAAAIFAKPALLEAITYVAATADPDSWAKLQQLSLIKRSKPISQQENEPERYDMLPLTRGYVLAELKAHTEFEAEARSRWVSWYRIFVEKYGGKDGKEWQDFSEIEAEWENLSEAIEWCIARELYEDVLYFWRQVKSYSYSRGRQRDRLIYWTVPMEWEDWLLQAAEARQDWSSAVEVMRDRAWKLTLKGRPKDLEDADTIFARAWDLRNYRELSAQVDLAICIASLRIEQKQLQDALDWLKQGYELLEKGQGLGEQGDFSPHHTLHTTPYTPHTSSLPTLDDKEVMRFQIRLLHPEGQINYKSGEYNKAKIAFQKVLELAQSISWQRAQFLAKDWLGHIAIEEGDFDLAELLFLKSIDIAREKKDNCRIAFCKRGLARLEFERGNPPEACKRGREALAEFHNLGMTVEAEETKDMLWGFAMKSDRSWDCVPY